MFTIYVKSYFINVMLIINLSVDTKHISDVYYTDKITNNMCSR